MTGGAGASMCVTNTSRPGWLATIRSKIEGPSIVRLFSIRDLLGVHPGNQFFALGVRKNKVYGSRGNSMMSIPDEVKGRQKLDSERQVLRDKVEHICARARVDTMGQLDDPI